MTKEWLGKEYESYPCNQMVHSTRLLKNTFSEVIIGVGSSITDVYGFKVRGSTLSWQIFFVITPLYCCYFFFVLPSILLDSNLLIISTYFTGFFYLNPTYNLNRYLRAHPSTLFSAQQQSQENHVSKQMWACLLGMKTKCKLLRQENCCSTDSPRHSFHLLAKRRGGNMATSFIFSSLF
mgnify:CR=1 FL=1